MNYKCLKQKYGEVHPGCHVLSPVSSSSFLSSPPWPSPRPSPCLPSRCNPTCWPTGSSWSSMSYSVQASGVWDGGTLIKLTFFRVLVKSVRFALEMQRKSERFYFWFLTSSTELSSTNIARTNLLALMCLVKSESFEMIFTAMTDQRPLTDWLAELRVFTTITWLQG